MVARSARKAKTLFARCWKERDAVPVVVVEGTVAGLSAQRASLLLCLLTLLCTCGRAPEFSPPKTTFYHWETSLAPDSTARSLLTEHNCDRLYAKAFDVSWANGQPEPTALIRMTDTVGLPQLVPVVFITNEVFLRQPAHKLEALAEDIVGLTEELFGTDFPELQIDCDWTARTQVPYFDFLRAVYARLEHRSLTCTIRLHQYRDRDTQGVPPLNRATLMAYNVGNLNAWETENSIVDTNILKTYLSGTERYPINLDLAIAAYDWAAVYRRDELTYLINEPDMQELGDTSRFVAYVPTGASQRWRVRQSTYLDGIYLYEGDLLRHEVALPGAVNAQVALLSRYIPGFAGQRAMVYRLGSRLWE
ncbi:hypothetical protein FUA23_06000 [Neolewinella aurantiaca]|uniref:Uncharacterized protein n=1 Tax=Neolewinella aurantiaca TaxID=2602767 RepID=A0A5C7FKW8_9BACT|nr:hypothetical protein [Neolewinella aurantiaca]TXF90645.1 hypothetical protein FUA23_06000 [Neolewinella aurantiaca]